MPWVLVTNVEPSHALGLVEEPLNLYTERFREFSQSCKSGKP